MRIQEMAQAVTPTRWPTIVEIGTAAAAVAGAYLALAQAGDLIGIHVTLPWSGFEAKADALTTKFDTQQEQLSKQQNQIDVQQKQLDRSQCLVWRILKDGYKKDEQEADTDLARTPGLATARRQKAEAQDNIAEMNANLATPECRAR